MVEVDLNNDASSLPDGLFPVPLGLSKLGSWSGSDSSHLATSPITTSRVSSKFLCL